MKVLLLLSTFGFAKIILAQEIYEGVLLTDPMKSNGYFIVDQAGCSQLGIATIVVHIIQNDRLTNGTYTHTVVQTLDFAPSDFFAHGDLSFVPDLDEGDYVGYTLHASDANGIVVKEFSRDDGSGDDLWELCRYTCDAPAYAWALRVSSDLSQSVISIDYCTANGSYIYFYVLNEDWNDFITQFIPSDFGLTHAWSEYASLYTQTEVIDGIEAEATMRDYQGFLFGADAEGEFCHGIRKDRGPWRQLFATTDVMVGGPSEFCTNDPEPILDAYNDDSFVLFQMAQNGLPPLNCEEQITEGGGWNSWGPGGTGICLEFFVADGLTDYDGDGDIDPVGWTSQVVECDYTVPEIYRQLSNVSSVLINYWDPIDPARVLTINIPDEDDPRLVPVERTTLEAGLYEFVIVLRNGALIRKFQHYDTPVVIAATFADFTGVVVYPVPVTDDSFSVDFDLLAPMNISLTVLNNQGTVYHSKNLSFPLAGHNKYLVEMPSPWPMGLYHVIVSYEDGSTESINITVE